MNALQDRVGDLLQQCRHAGLRRTECLRAILSCLVGSSIPVSVQELLQRDELRGRCDPATVYRLLSRLEERQIIRQVGLPKRAAHYILNDKHDSRAFVVCLSCGIVKPLDIALPEQVLKDVSEKTGFEQVYHEAQFYGYCTACQEAGRTGYRQTEGTSHMVAEDRG